MKTYIFMLILAMVLPINAQSYLNGQNPKLTPDQKKAAKLTQQHFNASNYPILGEGGSVIYLYNAGIPTLICQPLMACTIDLQHGEVVSSMHCGDKNRWSVYPVTTETQGVQKTSIIVKPKDSNLETILLIFTDKRKYHIKLLSHKSKFYPSISFEYPESTDTKWEDYLRQVQAAKKVEPLAPVVIKESKIEKLDFAYTIKGDARWKPKRVFNDGIKTKIEMPQEMRHHDAPVLLVLERSGDERIVNYTFQKDSYIIDYIFDKAILISGVGKHQEKIIITRDRVQ